MIQRVYSVRGATTVDVDTVEEVTARSVELMQKMLIENKIGAERKIVHYIISMTDDIRSCYPATAIRLSGLTDAPVFSCLEPPVENALDSCIRILMEVADSGTGTDVKHVYLHGATALRRDLTEVNEDVQDC